VFFNQRKCGYCRNSDSAIDLGALQQLNYFEGIELTDDMFMQDTLNDFISDGKKTWRLVRNRIAEIFDENNAKLRDNAKDRDVVILKWRRSKCNCLF
jgi:fumarylacetoacetase